MLQKLEYFTYTLRNTYFNNNNNKKICIQSVEISKFQMQTFFSLGLKGLY